MATSLDQLDRILALARAHRPGLRLVDKADSPWMRAASWLVWPFMPTFLTEVTTVVGDTVYTPGPPETIRRPLLARILAHELVHQLDQAEHPIWFYVSYGVVLPTGRTWRAWWERRAYGVDLMLAWEEGALVVEDELRADNGWASVAEAGQSGFQVGLTTVMARVWEPAQFQEWQDLTERLAALGDREPLVVRQVLRRQDPATP